MGESLVNSAEFENVVEERDVADRQSEDLDLGQFLVWRQRRQHPTQSSERRVERFDANPFPGRVSCPIALRRPALPTTIYPAEVYLPNAAALVYHVDPVRSVYVDLAESVPRRVSCPVALRRSAVSTSLLTAAVASRHDPHDSTARTCPVNPADARRHG